MGTLCLILLVDSLLVDSSSIVNMAPMKKAMKSMKASSSKAMSKGALLKLLATENEMKTKDCSYILNSLVTVATKEVKKTGIFTIPGICRIKTRTRPATKARVVMMFGEEKKVKAKPAKTVVKAYPVAALKQQI